MIASRMFLAWFAWVISATLLASCASVPQSQSSALILLSTDMGNILVEVYPDRAPQSAGSFLRYVDEGLYDDAGFYRVVRPDNDRGEPVITVIQGGVLTGDAPQEGVPHESTEETGLTHVDGALSLARADPGTGSAAAFFISVGAQPALDYGALRNLDGLGFAVFGQVIEGMEIVRSINALSAEAPSEVEYVQGQILSEPIRFRAKRIPH